MITLCRWHAVAPNKDAVLFISRHQNAATFVPVQSSRFADTRSDHVIVLTALDATCDVSAGATRRPADAECRPAERELSDTAEAEQMSARRRGDIEEMEALQVSRLHLLRMRLFPLVWCANRCADI